ncbi:protein MENT [Alligator mississippiensis]|uniref:Protein MENT n=2 Tax=Alligator mississippiensis TaxID=8496 RepID=A0A151M558_ALLMI|nr:protein MENT [Alligator mississippiensis]
MARPGSLATLAAGLAKADTLVAASRRAVATDPAKVDATVAMSKRAVSAGPTKAGTTVAVSKQAVATGLATVAMSKRAVATGQTEADATVAVSKRAVAADLTEADTTVAVSKRAVAADLTEVDATVAVSKRAVAPGLDTAVTPGAEATLSVGDPGYQWQPWGQWFCNCEAGSMARVRDVNYTVPDVVLAPDDLNALRFQRVPCKYRQCPCSRQSLQCAGKELTCDAPRPYLCAVRDIREAQYHESQRFWRHIRSQLRDLWDNVRRAFIQEKAHSHKES